LQACHYRQLQLSRIAIASHYIEGIDFLLLMKSGLIKA